MAGRSPKNRNKSKVRARVEHVFAVVKRLWGFTKVRYRGLASNATRSFVSLEPGQHLLGAPAPDGMSAPAMRAKCIWGADRGALRVETGALRRAFLTSCNRRAAAR